jgi:hypothetical protein
VQLEQIRASGLMGDAMTTRVRLVRVLMTRVLNRMVEQSDLAVVQLGSANRRPNGFHFADLPAQVLMKLADRSLDHLKVEEDKVGCVKRVFLTEQKCP